MKISTISLFPEIFSSLDHGIIGRAINTELIQTSHKQLRDYSLRDDGRIDDRPFGGGCGMILSPEPLLQAITDTKEQTSDVVIHLCPTGKTFNQATAKKLALANHLIFVCSRYEGIDARMNEHINMSLSLGDFVLTGGELAAMCMIDCIVREIPGTLGNEQSRIEDSYQSDRLDYPHFTRPWNWRRQSPSDVLRSGNHRSIEDWKKQQIIGRTWLCRPDLMLGKSLSDEDIKHLETFLKQNNWE